MAETLLAAVRARVGAPPRKAGWFGKVPIDAPKPDWAKSDDPLVVQMGDYRALWEKGQVVWSVIVLTDRTMLAPGENDAAAEVLYSLSDPDDTALIDLMQFQQRLNLLRRAEALPDDVSQQERELRDELRTEGACHKGYPLPESWATPDRNFRLSTVLLHRNHLAKGFIWSRLQPLLVLPEPPHTAAILPADYWGADLAAYLEQLQSDRVTRRFEDNRLTRERAFDAHFGTAARVHHEVQERGVHIDVYEFPKSAGRHHVTYMTGGMSDQIQPGSVSPEATCIELMVYALAPSDLIISLLRNFAHYPWETGSALNPGDTLPLGVHAEKVLGTSRFPYLLMCPHVRPEDEALMEAVTIDGQTMRPLVVVPISQDEFETMKDESPDILLERLEDHPEHLIFDPNRPSLLEQPGH